MIRLFIIAILLTGCNIDTRQYQAEVVRNMMFAGYNMTNLEHNPKIIIDSCDNMPCDASGCYNLSTKTIYMCVDIPKVVKHEFSHFYMHQLHIPLEEHHGLIGELGY